MCIPMINSAPRVTWAPPPALVNLDCQCSVYSDVCGKGGEDGRWVCAEPVSVTTFLGCLLLYLLSLPRLHGWPFWPLPPHCRLLGGRDSITGLESREVLGTGQQIGICEYPVLSGADWLGDAESSRYVKGFRCCMESGNMRNFAGHN